MAVVHTAAGFEPRGEGGRGVGCVVWQHVQETVQGYPWCHWRVHSHVGPDGSCVGFEPPVADICESNKPISFKIMLSKLELSLCVLLDMFIIVLYF
jgi:hypothetical protein